MTRNSIRLNRVYNKDVMEVLKRLPDACIDLIYSDPDYNVGVKYGCVSYTKGFDEYITWYIGVLRECIRVLKNSGNMFLINYPKQHAYVRVRYLDSVCYDIQDYSWVYNTNVGHSPKRFTTAHRSILHCRKTKNNNFHKDAVALLYKNPGDKRIQKRIRDGSKGIMPYSWFYFDLVKNVSSEKTKEPWMIPQIPQKLSEMLIKATTKPRDVVFILFGGSGSELEVCKRLKRRFLSAEIDKTYYKKIKQRLKNLEV